MFESEVKHDMQPAPLWGSMVEDIASYAGKVAHRKRPGRTDAGWVHEVRGALHQLQSTVPDHWPDDVPAVPKDVRAIIDDGARYEYVEAR